MSSNRDVHGGDIRSNAQGQNLREQISQLRERMAYLGRRCDRAQASKKKRDLVEVDLPPRRRRARRGKLRALPRHQGLAVRGEVLAGHGRRSAAAADLPSRLRNSWGWRLGAVLNSPGKHPFALDRRLDAGSGGPAARREVEVGLFRRVADRASEHRWVTDAGRAPRGVAGGALVMSPGVRAGRR